MEKLLEREVIIFPENIKSFNILLKFIKPTPNCKKSLPGVQTFEKMRQICQDPKLKILDYLPSTAYAKSLFKTFLDIKVLFVNRFSKFLRHILGLKGC